MQPPRDSTGVDAVLAVACPGERGATRRAVLRHALDCFHRQGIEATTIDDLRQRSGQSVGSIYHHFGNKEGVAAALFFAGFDDQTRAIARHTGDTPDARAMVHALVEAYAAWVTAQPEMAAFLFMARETIAQGPHGEALVQRLQARYDPIDARLAQGMAAGQIAELPGDLIPALVLGATESYCRGWLAGRRQLPPTAHAAHLADAAWRSLSA